ncbi:DUF6065 family protein [Streptomyces sp. NPDC002537]
MSSAEHQDPEPVVTAYRLPGNPDMPIVPAPAQRDWLDRATLRYTYRCLPLRVANQNGWSILNNSTFTVHWNGGDAVGDLTVRYPKEGTAGSAVSHFGYGILTFHIPYLIRTPPGWNLLVRGPANVPKDGAHPLEGLVEADWAVATFTMNWKITRPGVDITFLAGEPVLMLVPQRRGDLEGLRPRIVPLARMPDADDHRAWSRSRLDFAQAIAAGDPSAADGWQRHYMGGTHPGTTVPFPEHQRSLRLRSFTETTGEEEKHIVTSVQDTPLAARVPVISTVAGTGITGSSGDGGPAGQATLSPPFGVGVDSEGNVYIADTGNHRVRRVDAGSGTISTVAGNGTAGFSGDGGPAVQAALKYPRGVGVDSEGNLYIADTGNHRVRRVDAGSGTISTVAGNGTAGSFGDDGLAVQAALNLPFGVVADSLGNLYIADKDNHRVRKVDAGTRTISTVAGDGTPGSGGDAELAVKAQLNLPNGVAVDPDGNICIADTGNHRVRRVDARTQVISTVAGRGGAGFSGDGGPAVQAALSAPGGVGVDFDGTLYIADTGNRRVRKVDAGTRTISTVAGNGTAGFSGDGGSPVQAALNAPSAVVVDPDGSLYIADKDNRRVRKVSGVSSAVRFSVLPGGPPDVTLTRAGEIGYVGVRLRAEEDGPFTPQTVRVALPPGRGLQYVAEAYPDYQLTVQDAQGAMHFYLGALSSDGQTLTFENVDLALSGRGSASAVWVAVKASPDAPIGDTHLNFQVGGRTSRSTPVHVVARFSVAPGVPPDVTLPRDGGIRYPGVRLRAEEDGPFTPQTVRVALPPGRGLQFVAEAYPDYQLTVQDAQGAMRSYYGALSSDGQALTFEDVDLALSGRGSASAMWVAVRASSNAPLGDTYLDFQVGGRTSRSTPLHIVTR